MSLASLTRVWEHSKQKGSALVLTLALADIGNDDGFSFPGLDWLAERTRMSRRQTQRLLDQLQAENEIYMQQRNTGRGHTPEYLVLAGLDAKRIKNSLMRYFDMDEATATEKGDILSQRVPKRRPLRGAIKGDKLSKKGDISGNKGRHAHAQNATTRNYPQDSKDSPESVLGESESEILEAVAKVTGCDPQLNEAEVSDLARDLHKAAYSAQDVLTWHQNFWLNDWKSKGGSPSLRDVRRLIGQVRAAAAQGEDGDRYTDDAYFQGRNLDDQPAVAEQPARKAYTGKWNDQWQATLGQLSIQLTKATYDTWLKRLILIDVVEREDDVVEFKAEVPDHYVKDWIERHLTYNFERTLCDICHFHSEHRRLKSGRAGAGVKITLEDGSL